MSETVEELEGKLAVLQAEEETLAAEIAAARDEDETSRRRDLSSDEPETPDPSALLAQAAELEDAGNLRDATVLKLAATEAQRRAQETNRIAPGPASTASTPSTDARDRITEIEQQIREAQGRGDMAEVQRLTGESITAKLATLPRSML